MKDIIVIETSDTACEVTRISPWSMKVNTMQLPVSRARVEAYYKGASGTIQSLFPELDAAQREFVKTGYTDADWAEMFKGGEN